MSCRGIREASRVTVACGDREKPIETSRFSTVVSKLLEDAEAKPLRQTEPGPDEREVEAFSSGEAGLVVFHVL